MKRLIVVDVSNFIFRAFFAIRPLHSPDGTPVNAVYGVLTMLMKLFAEYRPSHLLLARDMPGGSFRNEIYPQYKANRDEPPEDLVPQFDLIHQLIEKMKIPHCADGEYEADDIIGSVCHQWREQFDEILIASGDKDLMQMVGGPIKMLDTMKSKIYDERGVFEKMGVWPKQIVDYLSMVGDSSDNIPGMKGIGAKGAAKLLAEHETLENCVEAKDSLKGKKLTTAFSDHLEDAFLSKKLVTIVQDMDLGLEVDSTRYSLSPGDELIAFLKELGFKGIVQKLENLKTAQGDSSQDGGAESRDKFSFEHKTVEAPEYFEEVMRQVDSCAQLALHVEFDTENLVDQNILWCSLSFDGQTSYSFKSQYTEQLLAKLWGRQNLKVGSVDWKRNMAHAQETEVPVKCQSFDIVQAHYILEPEAKHSLEFLVQSYFLYQLKSLNPEDGDGERIQHCGERSCFIFKLMEIFEKELKEKNLASVYYQMDDPLIPVLVRIERQGILINPEFFYELEEEMAAKLESIEQKIFSYNNGTPLNLNSPKQVGEFLFDKLKMPILKKTKTGVSTDSEVLERLEAKQVGPVPGLMLQYREIGKLLSTYVKALPKLVHPKTKRLHTHFNQNVAATGRLSSNNPNLQNIPIRTELGRRIRQGFIAHPGKMLLGADYSQIELRLLAHFSGDETMLDSFRDGIDIHRQTASEVLGVPLGEVTSEQRSMAKAVNFGLMYGQSSFGLANQLRIGRHEARAYITTYFERFGRIKGYLDTLKEKAEKTGYATTLWGRKRHLPDMASKNRTIKSAAERIAINSPIQGTAADIVKKAMIAIDRRILRENLQSRMLLQVHDELILEVLEGELGPVQALVREEMEGVAQLAIPLTVDIKAGVNWHDLK